MYGRTIYKQGGKWIAEIYSGYSKKGVFVAQSKEYSEKFSCREDAENWASLKLRELTPFSLN